MASSTRQGSVEYIQYLYGYMYKILTATVVAVLVYREVHTIILAHSKPGNIQSE